MKRKDFQELAALRLKEANVLLKARCWDGAYYLAGYAVECALKACISKRTERHDFPDKKRANDVHTHQLVTLIKYSGLDEALKALERTNPELDANWVLVRDWSQDSRYGRPSQIDAENLLRALTDRKHGVLRWLRQRW